MAILKSRLRGFVATICVLILTGPLPVLAQTPYETTAISRNLGEIIQINAELATRRKSALEFQQRASSVIIEYASALQKEDNKAFVEIGVNLFGIVASFVKAVPSRDWKGAGVDILQEALSAMRSAEGIGDRNDYRTNLIATTEGYRKSYTAELEAIASLEDRRDALFAGAEAMASNAQSQSTKETTPAATQACRGWSDLMELSGTISRKTYPGRPNFESIEDGDAAVTVPILTLSEPFCLEKGVDNGDEYEPAMAAVQELQVTQTYPPDGSTTLKGRVFHSHTGHHFTEVLLAVETPKCLNWGDNVTLAGTVTNYPVDDYAGGTIDLKMFSVPAFCVDASPDQGYPAMADVTEMQIVGEGFENIAAGTANVTGQVHYNDGDAATDAILTVGMPTNEDEEVDSIKGRWSLSGGSIPEASYVLEGNTRIAALTLFCTGSDSLGLKVVSNGGQQVDIVSVQRPNGEGMAMNVEHGNRVVQAEYALLVGFYNQNVSAEDDATGEGRFPVQVSEGYSSTGEFYDLVGMRSAREALRLECGKAGEQNPSERVTEWQQVRQIMGGLMETNRCQGTVLNINDNQVTCRVGGERTNGIVFRLYNANASTSDRVDRQSYVLGSVTVEVPQRIFAGQNNELITQYVNTVFGPLGLSQYTSNLLADLERGKSGFNRNAGPGVGKQVIFANDPYGLYGQTFEYTLVWNCKGGASRFRVCASW